MQEDDDTFLDDDILSDIDFSILTMRWRDLSLFADDLFLGMQGMNIGITDQAITAWEYGLLREYNDMEGPNLHVPKMVQGRGIGNGYFEPRQ